MSSSSDLYAASSGEMEGWLKKKSPKTQGKKMMDVWQKRYFVLSAGELKYYKTEKAAHLSNAESLKAIRLEHVIAATANPRHADMFIIDLGLERKVKLQAGSEQERDAWVAAIEAAKLKAWNSQEENAFRQVVQETRRPGGGSGSREIPQMPAPQAAAFPNGSREPSNRQSHADPGNAQFHAELLRSPGRKQGCCIIS